MSVSYYNLYQDTQRLWRWKYVASNGKTIAVSSESYYAKSDAQHGIDLMKNSKLDPVV
ncbi:DUF1508 domain-containing protein [Sphingomonas sp. QA11]|uniref:YegP family protein n=1 Tax=Sphingomonas sp. QA11 TaxID=2950605 RepID=UPI002348FC00|nr:DUF1508 domain-containing protein [Sphingomonas sp. QA11]WCM28130.1 DUF1508 domain-containing protein [Sphingomonas sp. QA11]